MAFSQFILSRTNESLRAQVVQLDNCRNIPNHVRVGSALADAVRLGRLRENASGKADPTERQIARGDLMVSALLLLISIRIGLWIFPFRWLQEIARRAAKRAAARRAFAPARSESVLSLIAIIRRAAGIVPATTCLTQALTAQLLLARLGHSSTLRIGVLRAARGRIHAHAWLESAGRIVIGGDVPGLDNFKPLPVL